MKKYLLLTAILIPITAFSASTDVKVGDKILTKVQYDSLKIVLVDKIKKIKSKPISLSEAKDWIELAKISLKSCPISLRAGDNMIDVLNLNIEKCK